MELMITPLLTFKMYIASFAFKNATKLSLIVVISLGKSLIYRFSCSTKSTDFNGSNRRLLPQALSNSKAVNVQIASFILFYNFEFPLAVRYCFSIYTRHTKFNNFVVLIITNCTKQTLLHHWFFRFTNNQ